MPNFPVTSVLAMSIILTGCVAPAKYTWGNYDSSLHRYYKDSSKSNEHALELETIIQSAEKTNGKVAPGIYGEYGYFLMHQGRTSEALVQFEREKAAWPESTQLMTVMINMATMKLNKPLTAKE